MFSSYNVQLDVPNKKEPYGEVVFINQTHQFVELPFTPELIKIMEVLFNILNHSNNPNISVLLIEELPQLNMMLQINHS